ncbi:hypothetical protein [Marinobacter salexigens]|uniref:Pyocin activator protein PrtN n=1 Tax=Marinobacter salexigens TaxID=1925763 RepID=A0ABS6A7F2_9GAMM|nr:hypothetical protein [Marinobacter salexigens]MBU2873974.1 hypothetical protein [Marinobacter salexigens]
MRPVSIEDFIQVVFEYDSAPPAPSTVRRLCSAKDEFGLAVIPGAFKLGKAWKIDLDEYFREMERRMSGSGAEDDSFIHELASKLAS